MKQYRYILEPYKGMKSRYCCPKCDERGEYTRYIDVVTGNHVHSSVGICNRVNKCGHHYTPKEYFQDNNIPFNLRDEYISSGSTAKAQSKPASYIPVEIFKQSLQIGESVIRISQQNNFVDFLITHFGKNITTELLSHYFIGTSSHWNGATIFWQVDITGKIRTGEIILYNRDSGRRVKEQFNHVSWVHKMIKQPDFVLRQCFFGEHLLVDKTKPVAIVESAKTAIIASMYLPKFIWLSSGGIAGLNEDKCKVLKGREVVLFPDLGKGFIEWSKKAKELSHINHFEVSTLLEHLANDGDKMRGADFADYLINQDYLDFVLNNQECVEPPEKSYRYVEVEPEDIDTADYNEALRQYQISVGMIEYIDKG